VERHALPALYERAGPESLETRMDRVTGRDTAAAHRAEADMLTVSMDHNKLHTRYKTESMHLESKAMHPPTLEEQRSAELAACQTITSTLSAPRTSLGRQGTDSRDWVLLGIRVSRWRTLAKTHTIHCKCNLCCQPATSRKLPRTMSALW